MILGRKLMQNPRIHVMKAVYFMTLAALGLHAQPTLRCNLASKGVDTTVNGQLTPQCLNVNALNNDTVTLPSNVTRIDNQGLTLCTPQSDTSGGKADIVFAMDESNSMGLQVAFVSAGPTKDTSYYWDPAGCPAGSNYNPNSPTLPANISGFLPLQRISGTVYIPLLKSNTGCSDVSGDPFKIRAIAISQAIDSISSLSTVSSNSTVGFVPFAAQVIQDSARPQHPLSLTAANITTLKNDVKIDSQGGTNYNRPLDSAKQWLNNPLYTKTSKHDLVFITDGAPDADSNGLSKNTNGSYKYLDTSIHIYGIILAQNTSQDTAILDSLCKITHGRFFRVPPSRPDSLVGVIKLILHQIIRTYKPSVITLANATNGQTSRASGDPSFQDQGKSLSYKILLDSALGLKNNAVNAITLTSQFQEVDSANITQTVTTKFWLKTTNAAAGNSAFTGNLLTQCYAPTTLQWLEPSGLRPAYFTDADSAGVQVQLSSSNNGLTTARPTLKALIRNDSLAPSLPNSFSTTGVDTSFFAAAVPLSYNITPVKPGSLGTGVSDSLTANWVHPRDPQDFAHDAIGIHPTNIQATAYFSIDSNGVNDTSFFPITATQAYLIIKDQRGDPSRYTYRAVVTTTIRGIDLDTFSLKQSGTTPGLFYALIPLSQAAKAPGDHQIEFSSLGDQMAATYVDPVYGDQAFANAGIGEHVVFQPSLVFTDSLGNQIVSGSNPSLPLETFWSLTHNKVYLKVIDNNTISSVPAVASIPVQLTATSLKLGQSVAQDVEQDTLKTRTVINNAVATWTGNLPLAESLAPAANHILEGAYRIEVVATAPAHDSTGQLTGQIDTAKLAIAWPDSVPSVTFKDTVNESDSLGPTNVYLTLKDQDFVHSVNNESITATAVCPGATPGDSVVGLNFTQSTPGGKYASELLVRDTQTPNLQDRVLSCPADSGVVIHYTDPVYSTLSQFVIPQALAPIANPPGGGFSTAASILLQSNTPGARINYTLDTVFLAPTLLPRPGQPFAYQGPVSITNSEMLRAVASDTSASPRFLRSQVSSNRYLKQPAARGYAKDFNRDGLADVVLVFEKPITSVVPDTIDSVYWNTKTPANRRSVNTGSQTLSLVDSLTLKASPNPSFALYTTGLPTDTTLIPGVVSFPVGGYYNGLQVTLDDSVGPVPSMARKLPSDLQVAYTDSAGDKIVDPDTLIITASEPLDSNAHLNPWQGLFRFKTGANCSDPSSYTGSQTISTVENLTQLPDPTLGGVQEPVFHVVVDNRPGVAVPQLGDCIYLEANSGFTDLNQNLPSLAGVTLTGAESPKIVRNMNGYPPVSGLTPGTSAFKSANGSTSLTTKTDPSGAFQWIAPVHFPSGWKAGNPYTPTVTVTLSDSADPSTVEAAGVTTIPQGISTLQVVTAGKYIAHVHLADNLGRFVKSWDQQFGFDGELANPNRTSGSGKLSYLAWDERDSHGNIAGQGVYVWNVIFETEHGKQILVTRTGLVR